MIKPQTQVVRDAIERFQAMPLRSIARYILDTNGLMFDNDLERIRSAVRYQFGACGEKKRNQIQETKFTRPSAIKMPQTWVNKQTPYHLNAGTWLTIQDIHAPYHEPKPLESAIKAGQAEKVTGIFINGDFQDCQAVSYWPQRKRDWNREVEITIDLLDFLRHEFPEADIVYKPGNHEYRLPRYYISKAPELVESPVTALETVLGLEERKIEFLDYFQVVYAGDLPILHGHEIPAISSAVNPARGLFNRTSSFAACGHCHRTSEHTSTSINNTMLTTWSFGCLCDLHPDYRPIGNQWNWGFAIISVEKNGFFEVINRRILANGKVV